MGSGHGNALPCRFLTDSFERVIKWKEWEREKEEKKRKKKKEEKEIHSFDPAISRHMFGEDRVKSKRRGEKEEKREEKREKKRKKKSEH